MGNSVEDDIDATDKFERERLSAYALRQNPQLKDYGEFKEAFFKAFSFGNGKNLPFIDEEHLKKLYESTTIREHLISTVGEEGIEEMEQTESDYQTVRGDGKMFEAKVIYAPKRVVKESYTRGGKQIKAYDSSYSKWTPSQKKFIEAELSRKTSTKDIIRKYNENFRGQQKTSSAIRTQIYRRRKS